MQIRTLLGALTILLSMVLTGCGGGGEKTSAGAGNSFSANHGQAGIQDDESATNILQIALGSPDHTTLVAAVKAAGLENVLVNPGPLTVFAPTNAAFDKLPPGTVEDLLKPENKGKLVTTIYGHASPGTYAGDLLKDGSSLYMADGHYVKVEQKDGDTYVHGIKILGSVDASNGVVHIVDDLFLY